MDTTEELVSRFRDYLEKNRNKNQERPDKVSLYSFYQELIAVKNEVRIEARLMKKGFADLHTVLTDHSRTDSQGQADEGEAAESREPPLLLLDGLLELHDRVRASIQALPEKKTRKKKFTLFGGSDIKQAEKEHELIDSMRTGQEMLLDRILGLLLACDVRPQQVLEQSFDPRCMRAMGSDNLPEFKDGVVTAEIRVGFRYQDRVLRLADVRVNRLSEIRS